MTGLTVAMRSCLLRAARKRLEQLNEEFESASTHGDIGADVEKMAAEMACVGAAIEWLWQQRAIDDK